MSDEQQGCPFCEGMDFKSIGCAYCNCRGPWLVGGLVEFSQTVGTMHEMTPRPEREDFDSDDAYYAACDQWFVDTHTFTGISGIEDSAPSDGDVE